MTEAMQMVKAEMGVEAIILSSRQERRKGIAGIFSRPVCEITAALDRVPAPRRTEFPDHGVERRTTKEEFRDLMLEPLAREVKELKDQLAQMRRDSSRPPQVQEPPVPGRHMTAEPHPAPMAVPVQQLQRGFPVPTLPKEELAQLKKLLLQAVARKEEGEDAPDQRQDVAPRKEQATTLPAAPDELERLGGDLRGAGVDDAVVADLLEEVRDGEAVDEGGDALRAEMREAIMGMVKCAGPLRLKKGVPRIMAMVGPTGVGKTTTIAKLAALYALEKGASVALVTLDNFRVGAVEQLKTYARIMGVPLETASTPVELEKILETHQDKDLILIDTAGRSHRDREKIEELNGFFAGRFQVDVHLCLAAATRDRALREIVDRYASLPVKKLVFTKLDESESFGSILNVHATDGHPLSYFTTGQRVPEDIEHATARKVADLIMGESAR